MIPLPSIVDFFFILSFLIALRALHNHQKRRRLPYPPGPRPLPIIGNLLDIPRESSWLAYTPFAKKHGTSYNLSGGFVVHETCRRCHVFPRSWTSHRHTILHQGHERSAQETRANLFRSSSDPIFRNVRVRSR
jgi:hypothetical protein